MAIDKETRDLIYKVQMGQKISIYLALLSPFGMVVLTFLWFLYYTDVFESYVPVFILDFAIMLYFFRSFVGLKKHEYEELPLLQKLKEFKKWVRSK